MIHARSAIAVALLCSSSVTSAAAPTDFTCVNRNAEIRCNAQACEVETEAFTPMSLSREGNQLEVCAYSGCWSGPLDLIRTRGELTILHARLRGWQGEGSAQVAIAFDRKEKNATMLWDDFAQALNCGGGD